MTVHLSFLLVVAGLTGIHSLTVNEVSAKAGDAISIPCFYDTEHVNHVKYLCKGHQWTSCSYAVKTNQHHSGKFSISDDESRRIFTVTIRDLTDKDTDDYWCAVEIDGGSDVKEKFHLAVTKGTPRLSVDHQEVTAFKGDDITINCHHHSTGEIAWCRPGGSCVTRSSGSIDGTRVTISRSVPNVFTVTMGGLRTESSGWYWCIKGHLQMPVHVTVTEEPATRIHSIAVSEASLKAGHSISIPCLYGSQYTHHVKYLCKGSHWTSCSYAIKTNQHNSEKFSISDNKNRKVFTVTIKDLTFRDSDVYWCAVEVDGGTDVGENFHLSVTKGTPHLTVDHQQITGFKGDNITVNCHYHSSGEIEWCRLGGYCITRSSGSIDGTRVTISRSVPNVFTVTMSGLRTESSGWYWCVKGHLQMPVHVTVTGHSTTTTGTGLIHVPPTHEPVDHIHVFASHAPTDHGGHASSSEHLKIFGIRLGVLILAVTVTLFICFMIKRHMQSKGETSAKTTAEEEVRYVKKPSVKKSEAETDVDGI